MTFRFQRPLESWSTLEGKIRAVLLEFISATKHQNTELSLGNAFHLRISRASNLHESFFVFGGYTDRDSGGWLLSEIVRNLRICVSEKTKKIAKVRTRYAEWWLVLVDRIGHGLDDFDHEQLRAEVTAQSLSGDWHKIILLHPHDHTQAVEL